MLMRARWFKKAVCSCFILFALLAASSASEGTVWYVTPGGGSEGKDGTSWAKAMDVAEFRQALKDEKIGEYWLAAGEYKPTDGTDDNPRTKSFNLKNDIALYGGFDGTENKRSQRDYVKNKTTLSGAISDDLGSYHVVYANGVKDTAILDGFTITGVMRMVLTIRTSMAAGCTHTTAL